MYVIVYSYDDGDQASKSSENNNNNNVQALNVSNLPLPLVVDPGLLTT